MPSVSETSPTTQPPPGPPASLPPPPAPAGLYETAVAYGGVVYTAGMTPRRDAAMLHPGRIGLDVDVAQAKDAARLAALRALSAASAAVGGVPHLSRLLRLTVYLACADGFTAHGEVADAASRALLDALGERARVARTACAVASLPGNACVEVELIAAYRQEPT